MGGGQLDSLKNLCQLGVNLAQPAWQAKPNVLMIRP